MKPSTDLAVVANTRIAAKLVEHEQMAAGAYSPQTVRALRGGTAIWSSWCAENGHQAVPADPEAVAAFIDAMATTRAVASVKQYVWAIAAMHRAADLDTPTTNKRVVLALKRMSRANGTRQRQAAPLNRPLVQRILEAAGDRLIDHRDRALISLAYDSLARRSELVALELADVTLTDDGTGTVLIKRSKTDQSGEGSVRFIAHDTAEHIKAWIEAAAITDGALFRSVHKSGAVGRGLHPTDVSRIYKRRAEAAGVDSTTVAVLSGHSTRIGAAQDLVAADLGIADVMQAGGWKTPRMVARYSEHQTARRGAMAKLAALQNRL